MNISKKFLLLLILFVFLIKISYNQDVTINIDVNQNKKIVSPYLYGANNLFDKPAQFYKDVGLKIMRTNCGNNATKYNWRKKITSHPDWYNNVYKFDWDQLSLKISQNLPEVQVMWAFQLLGRVASTNAYNFNDWEYNKSQWWEGVHQNLAGGGVINPDGGSKALVEGDVTLYTQEWPSDSTVEILNHWFGQGGLGLNKYQFLYWNMDNEPDIWHGTHDDVMKNGLLPANEFMTKYFEVAKKARAIFPEIKLCGPVVTNEWQWYKWGDEKLYINGRYYCWLEYFIKRCADEEKATGIRVLDVVDLHSYLSDDILQMHRVYYDVNYAFPGANGVKTINGGWDNSINKEYIFKRIEDWLNKHYGTGHGIKIGLSEWSPGTNDPNKAAVIYASHLGVFANNGVEYFIPWTWVPGMWEVMHLFSRYAKKYSVYSTSTLENIVSAYTTIDENNDSITVIIVNRDENLNRNVIVNINGTNIANGDYTTLQISSLPSTETFKSHTNNALKKSSVSLNSNVFTISVPPLSITAVLLKSMTSANKNLLLRNEIKLYPNPSNAYLTIDFLSDKKYNIIDIEIFNSDGKLILTTQHSGNESKKLDLSFLSKGFYLLKIKTDDEVFIRKISIQ